jgi:ArsR family metal-binding transcriptional regulator
MAKVLVFSDPGAFEQALVLAKGSLAFLETLEIPNFCLGLAAPGIIVTDRNRALMEDLKSHGVPVAGVLPYQPFKREIRQAEPPDPFGMQLLGSVRLMSLKGSASDPTRLRAEYRFASPLDDLIPFAARIVRGGCYRPEVPLLAFEEDHRLLVFSPEGLTICRLDDLLDLWTMIRTSVDLLISAWEMRAFVEPDRELRTGIGPVEIFKRLPGTSCRACGAGDCMEFAVSLFTRRMEVERCRPLWEAKNKPLRDALLWLLQVIGVTDSTTEAGPQSSGTR